ncbi:sensor histidine kinase [Auraticoccus monumenti]|uniref:Sensor-like histidine kinase SenX3 n=1 Tax=Auraticoccus monumenti TaxID=675864 RepID=A0A1G6ZI15_9ACTN|nr:ATP-binding protein [Auraticoccus monumenti]SDE02278.1 two-component system, OmpR family, sensor histidine kinase SenX3 [Auraticoccus monumenti]
MEILLAAVVGAVVGATIAVAVVVARGAAHRQTAQERLEIARVPVPDGVSQMLRVLRSAGVVVGPSDEVLEASEQARVLGLVRGSRVVHRELLELVRESRKDRDVRSVELELPRGGDQLSHFAVRVGPLAEDLVVFLAEDRTSAVRLEAIRRDFVTNVSHELKTPIGAISLLSEAVASAADEPETVLAFTGRMQHETARLTGLVAQIIQLSGVQADDPLLAPRVVDVDEVLAEAVDIVRVDAEDRGIRLRVAGREALQVMGDEGQLAMAVSNLVRNAVLYSEPGAHVTVSSRRAAGGDDARVEIRVRDTGIGIAAADLDRIFERFYRVDYSRSRANGGNGLGLSIVKHVAAAHGGDVAVWSKVGQGSTFTITLPEHVGEDDGPATVAGPLQHETQELNR